MNKKVIPAFPTALNMRALRHVAVSELIELVERGQLVGLRYISNALKRRLRATMYMLVQDGRLPSISVDGHVLIPRDAADAAIAVLKARPQGRPRRKRSQRRAA